MMDRLQLCTKLLAELGDRAPSCSAEEYEASIKDWTLRDFYGMVLMTKGPEIHIAIPKQCRATITRGKVHEALMPLVSQYGKAVTYVMSGHRAGHIFVHRLGFRMAEDLGDRVRYELLEPAYA